MNRLFIAVLLGVLTLMGTGCTGSASRSPGDMYARAQAIDALGYDQEAGFWYRKAAFHGHPIAQVEVGFMYRFGNAGLLRDPYEAQRWFLHAARQRPPTALADFGTPDAYSRNGVLRDAREAERWFRKGAASCRAAMAQGDLEAQTMLASLYGAGFGVRRDRATALRLWQDAAERGYAPAQLILGRLYGHDKTYDAARPWLMKAAAQGLPEAEYLLSELYQFGHGVEPDPEEAFRWLQRSAEKGYPFAVRQLRGMEALATLSP